MANAPVTQPIILEVCVDSTASALAAAEGGAQRIELCASLAEGGLTPSAGMIAVVRERLSLDIMVMIRPRGGDFYYSREEFDIMRHDIELAKSMGANGIVTGILTQDGGIDEQRTAELVALARPLSVTFHRAFDMVADPHRALESLIALGIDRLLTSGLEAAAVSGVKTIAALVEQAAGRLTIMPGGGINPQNVATILQQTGAREVHMSGRERQSSTMRFVNQRISLGNGASPEYSLMVTSADQIRASLAEIRQLDLPA